MKRAQKFSKMFKFLQGKKDTNVFGLICYCIFKMFLMQIIKGRTSNFAHEAIRLACLRCFYHKGSKSFRNHVDFKDAVPLSGILYIAAIVSSSGYFVQYLRPTFYR